MDNLMNQINAVKTVDAAKEILLEVRTMLANNLAAHAHGRDASPRDHEFLTNKYFGQLADKE
jgi:hypothetical protein